MVTFKGTPTNEEATILFNIIDADTPNIEFRNISFYCESIKDASGRIFKKVRHGYWIFDSEAMTLACSECGDMFKFDDVDGVLEFKEYAKHCITCGSEMDKENEQWMTISGEARR